MNEQRREVCTVTTEETSNSAQRAFRAHTVLRPRAQVEAQIREAILAGTFRQGDKLPPETQLAEQFGVSRPTIREALASLVTAGLIRKVPGVAGGSFINSVTPDSLSEMLGESMDAIVRFGTLEVTDLTEVRRILELPAARLAAVHRSDSDVGVLEAIVARQRSTTLDDPEIPRYDHDFHTTIGRASGNRLLAAFVAALHEATHPAEFLDLTPTVAARTVRQHMAIVSAIADRDAHRAVTAMAQHLDFVLRYSVNTQETAS